jgi:hypothetical protein
MAGVAVAHGKIFYHRVTKEGSKFKVQSSRFKVQSSKRGLVAKN